MSGFDASRPFEWPVRVYWEDTDAQGVVFYANYFRFLERVAARARGGPGCAAP